MWAALRPWGSAGSGAPATTESRAAWSAARLVSTTSVQPGSRAGRILWSVSPVRISCPK